MKLFDVFAWAETALNESLSGSRSLVVRCSAPACLYVSVEGYEVLAGVGTDFDLRLGEAYSWRVEGPKGCRVFYQPGHMSSVDSQGEVFTNTRMPEQSGSYFEVKKALREQKLQARVIMNEMRQATADLRAARSAAAAAQAAAAAPPAGADAAPAPADQAAGAAE